MRKTLLTLPENNTQTKLIDGYHIRYQYEKNMVEQYLQQLKNDPVVGQQLNEKLRYHCNAAFNSGLKSYSNRKDFEEVSLWCTMTQRELSKRGLYFLKADLTKLYLDLVEERDGFLYDTGTGVENSFKYQNMCDRVWALRYSISGKEAIYLAGKYYSELMSQFGIHCSNIPYANYLWGLTFYDLGEYQTAGWFFEQSIKLQKSNTQHEESQKSFF